MILDKLPKYFIVILLFGYVFGQSYDIDIWGISIGNAELEQLSENELSLTLKINELVNNIYPINLEYYSKYDLNYSVIESNKKAIQGRDKYKYSSIYHNDYVVYNEEDSIEINVNTHSFLSLLARIIESSFESIDTKWYDLENEGIIYKVRPLWNDTTTISIGNEEHLCDNYRLDLKIVNDNKNIFDETDYFNELFFDINSIRQIWVETWQKQRRLVKISIKNNLINLNLTIKK